ncbi:MAG: histidine ammonia-lyase [Castellaniella sp.]
MNSDVMEIGAGLLDLAGIRSFGTHTRVRLGDAMRQQVRRGHERLRAMIDKKQVVYGVNTGLGPLSSRVLEADQAPQLQQRLLLSNAVGVGPELDPQIVRLVLLLKVLTLSQGASGVSPALVDRLLLFLNEGLTPVIPSQGSVGASGDLAPLAHVGCALIGVGEVRLNGERMTAATAHERLGLMPYVPLAKEGLAIVNGTQVSTAIALYAYFQIERSFIFGLAAAALSLEAGRGTVQAFDARLHHLRRQKGQVRVAQWLRDVLQNSPLQDAAAQAQRRRVQDPYCLRCIPQVLGAVFDQLTHVAQVLDREIAAVTDNPLIDLDTGDVMYGGNFHAQPIGFCADLMAMCVTEMSTMSERRTAFLVDGHQSGLPDFLVDGNGLDSGFMVAQVTAAALASENKAMSFPASVDSIPTAANLEDHVSMATHAAFRLLKMIGNLENILSIELLAAAQGLDFLRPGKTSDLLEDLHAGLRREVDFWSEDRYFAPDIPLALAVARRFANQLGQNSRFGLFSC